VAVPARLRVGMGDQGRWCAGGQPAAAPPQPTRHPSIDKKKPAKCGLFGGPGTARQ